MWWWTQMVVNPDYDEPRRWWTQMVVAVIRGKCWEEELLGLAIFGRSGKNRKAQEKCQICALSPWRGDRTFTKIKQEDQSGVKAPTTVPGVWKHWGETPWISMLVWYIHWAHVTSQTLAGCWWTNGRGTCVPTLYSLMGETVVNSAHKYAIAKFRRKLWKKHAYRRLL